MGTHPEVDPSILDKLRAICLGLPDAYEEAAWAGTRWCVAKKNFAHAVAIADGWPPAYAQAAQHGGPLNVLTFRLPIARLQSPRYRRAPFFKPVWFADVLGLRLDADADWDEIEELLIASYRVLAPKKLARRLEAPRG